MLNYISDRDHKLMRRVNRWPAPRWIRLWALCATHGGDGWLWYGMAVIILLFGGPMRFRALSAAAMAAAPTARKRIGPPNSKMTTAMPYHSPPSPPRVAQIAQRRTQCGAGQRLTRRISLWSRCEM